MSNRTSTAVRIRELAMISPTVDWQLRRGREVAERWGLRLEAYRAAGIPVFEIYGRVGAAPSMLLLAGGSAKWDMADAKRCAEREAVRIHAQREGSVQDAPDR